MKKNTLIIQLLLLLSAMSMSCAAENELDLRLYERRLISQNGEDGILQKIFDVIGTTNKFYVEFGAGKGHFCSNTKYLREKFGWYGLLLEGSFPDDLTINLHQEFITAENICNLFEKYGVPYEFDLISIDIDRNDFYVWKSLGVYYKPRVVVIEFNSCFNFNEDKVIKYDPNAVWDASENTGASILALFNLGKKLGYSLVYQESTGSNLFFIRNDVIESNTVKFKNINNLAKLYTAYPQQLNLNKTEFVTSEEILSLK